MNIETRKNTVLIEKVPKLRVLLPLLVLGYVGLGGFVVPHVDIAVGHIIMAILAAVSVVVTILSFMRYDEAYHSSSNHYSIFTATVVVVMYWVGTIGVHIAAVVNKEKDTLYLFLMETMLVALIAAILLMIGKKLGRD
jgi:heme/copper-type cytochrome/quinol oxidase subunit 4